MMRIVVVGGGNVADGLVHEIVEAEGLELVGQWTRKTHTPEELAPADLYILAVSDVAVPEVSDALPFPENSVVAHTAGCVEMSELSTRIAHRAVLYPLQTFTKGRRIADFRRTPLFIEGETPHALETVRTAACALSDNVKEMCSDNRARIHLAGAFANNFSNAMLSLGEMLAADAGETFESLRPIVAETMTKALEMPSPRMAQTGAAQRGDATIRAKHLAMLARRHPELIPMYEEISDTIWRISKKN